LGYEIVDAVDRYWLGLPVRAHFLDEQYLTQPSSIGPGIGNRLKAVLRELKIVFRKQQLGLQLQRVPCCAYS
jgi:hypothetical protein